MKNLKHGVKLLPNCFYKNLISRTLFFEKKVRQHKDSHKQKLRVRPNGTDGGKAVLIGIIDLDKIVWFIARAGKSPGSNY